MVLEAVLRFPFLWFLLQTKHQERSQNCNNLLTETACVIQMELHLLGTSSGSIFIPQGHEDRPVSSPHSFSTFFISLFPLSSFLSSSPTSPVSPPPFPQVSPGCSSGETQPPFIRPPPTGLAGDQEVEGPCIRGEGATRCGGHTHNIG